MILTKRFSIEEDAGNLIYRTGLALKAYAQRFLKESGFDIPIEQAIILHVLMQEEGLSQKEIGDILLKDKPNVSRLLDSLERRRFIHRQPTDRRTYAVFLTSEGKELISKILPIIEELRQQFVHGLLTREIETLKSILNKIYDNVSQ